MTGEQAVNMIGNLADGIIDANDATMAAAEAAFFSRTGLQFDDDITAEAMGALFCTYGEIWRQVSTAAFWAGFNAAPNGKV